MLTSSESCVNDNTATSNEITIQVDQPITETPQTPSGDQSVCTVANLLNYTVAAVTNATAYTWILPAGWTIVSGTGTNNISVNITGVASGNYNVSVRASNSCGTTAASANLPVSVGDYATADAGPDQTICFNTASINVDGIAGGAAASNKGSWTTSGSGTFFNDNKPSTTYTPSAADRTSGNNNPYFYYG